MNKRFTRLCAVALVFALACSTTPVLPAKPADTKKTEKKDKGLKGYWKSFKKSVRKIYRKAKKEYKKNDEVVPYVLGATALLISGWLIYKKLIPWWFGVAAVVTLNKNIVIGKSACKGDERTVADNAVVKQVRVKSQFDSDGGGAASCGYHTLKNLILLAQGITLNKTDIFKEVCDAQVVQRLFGPEGEWRKLIPDQRQGDWVSSEYLDRIIRNESTANSKLCPDNVPCNIVTIDDIDLVGLVGDLHQEPTIDPDAPPRDPYEGVACPVTVIVGRGIANNPGRDYLVGFCINTAKQFADEKGLPQGKQGHWIGLLFHRKADGGREYIAVDSLNCRRINSGYVQPIVDVIERVCASQ